jgi:hypothetical protein
MSMLKRYQHVYDAVEAEAGRTLDAHFAQAGIFEQLKMVADADHQELPPRRYRGSWLAC